MGYTVQANKQSDVVESVLQTTQNSIATTQSTDESLSSQLNSAQNKEVYFQIED